MSDPSQPVSPDPPVDWAQHYADGDTPWDHGVEHPELAARLGAGELAVPTPGARALVPGCGRGHDALALARIGWTVTALDQVPALEELVNTGLRPLGGEFQLGDALAWAPASGEPEVDLVFDHTFLCAIDLEQRPQFVDLVLRALRPGGQLACLLFPVGKPREDGGPPHSLDVEQVGTLFGDSFELVEHAPSVHTIEQREYGEHWARFVRR
jgi:SAM-dependent methyltransferase